MSTFNAYDYFRKHGKGTTKIKGPDGVNLTLQGLPSAYTSKALAALARADGVKASFPTQVVSGREVTPRAKIEAGEDAVGAVHGILGEEEEQAVAA